MGKIMQADSFLGETLTITSGFVQNQGERGAFFIPLNGGQTIETRINCFSTFVSPFKMVLDSIIIKNVSETPNVSTVQIEVLKNQRREIVIVEDVQDANSVGAYVSIDSFQALIVDPLDTLNFTMNTNRRSWENAVAVITFKKV
tara:strand:+ start:166 stop:597 length:432 start_codon:yes stop_codon:yes gene_type:complete